MRSSSSDSDRTYDSSCSENSSDSRRLSSSATRRRSRSLCTSRRRRATAVQPSPPSASAASAPSTKEIIGCALVGRRPRPIPRQDAGPLLIERAQRTRPCAVGEALIADGHVLPEADALVEQVDRHGLLARVELIGVPAGRSEEHTSELQSQSNLVCRLLLEKKNSTTECTASYTDYLLSTQAYKNTIPQS